MISMIDVLLFDVFWCYLLIPALFFSDRSKHVLLFHASVCNLFIVFWNETAKMATFILMRMNSMTWTVVMSSINLYIINDDQMKYVTLPVWVLATKPPKNGE